MIHIEYTPYYLRVTAKDNPMVIIIHRKEDGYLPAADGTQIRENLPLKDFIDRLANYEGSFRGKNPVTEYERLMHLVERGRSEGKTEALCGWLDAKYSMAIQEGKLRLPQHYMHQDFNIINEPTITTTNSIGMAKIGTITDQQKEMVRKAREMKEENLCRLYPMTPDEAYRVYDDEIYYLLTP